MYWEIMSLAGEFLAGKEFVNKGGFKGRRGGGKGG